MRKINNLMFTLLMLICCGIANAATVSYNIEEGATYKQFDGNFKITIEGASDVMTDSWAYVYFGRIDADGQQISMASNSMEYNKDDNSINVIFPNYNLWPDYPVETDGEYYVQIPSEAYFIDGVANEETVITFNIDGDERFVSMADVTIDPAPCKFESIFEKLTITLPEEVTSVTFNEVAAGSDSYSGTISDQAQFGQMWYGSMTAPSGHFDIAVEGNKLILTPSADLTLDDMRAGDWGIRILRGQMYFNGDETKTNDNIVFGPYVYPEFLELNFTPKSGNKVVDMTKFKAVIEYLETDVVVDENVVNKLYIFNTESESYEYVCDLNATCTTETDNYGWKNAYLEFTPATTETLAYGKYKLEIAKGAFKTIGEEPLISNATIVEYEYIEMPSISRTPTWSISEGETLTSFKEVTLTFEEASKIARINEYVIPYIALYKVVDGEQTPYGGGSGTLEARITGNEVKLYMTEDVFYPNYPLEEDGEYRIIVPEARFAFEGVDAFYNEELVLNFKIDAIEPPITQDMATIDPAPSVVKDMNRSFTITLEGVEGEISVAEVVTQEYDYGLGDYVDVVGPAKAELSVYAYGMNMPFGKYDISVDGNTITLTPDESLSQQTYWEYGDYTVTLPKGALIIDNDPLKCNARMSFSPYKVEHLIYLTFENPKQGAVESLSTFNLSSDAYGEPTTTDASLITISKMDESTGEYVVLDNAITSTASQDPDTWEVSFDLALANEITEAGKYQLSIERGAYVWEDYFETYPNAAVVGEFEIKGAVDPEEAFTILSVDPEEGTYSELKDITITFDNKYFEDGLWVEDGTTASVVNSEMLDVVTATLTADEQDAKVYVSLAEVLNVDGVYNVMIAEGAISEYNNAFASPAILLTYTIENGSGSVEAIDLNKTDLNIYSLDGVLIKRNGKAADLKNLNTGIYIINGHKVFINK